MNATFGESSTLVDLKVLAGGHMLKLYERRTDSGHILPYRAVLTNSGNPDNAETLYTRYTQDAELWAQRRVIEKRIGAGRTA